MSLRAWLPMKGFEAEGLDWIAFCIIHVLTCCSYHTLLILMSYNAILIR